MSTTHNCLEYKDFNHRFTKSDTDGEAIFVIASMLKHQLFNRSSDKNHAYFRLRHQYHFW